MRKRTIEACGLEDRDDFPWGLSTVHKLPQLHSHGWDVTGAWLNGSLVHEGGWLLAPLIYGGGDANVSEGARRSGGRHVFLPEFWEITQKRCI